MNKKLKYLATAIIAMGTYACQQTDKPTWTEQETERIGMQADTRMRLWTVDNPEDSTFLRQACAPLTRADIATPQFETLKQRMLLTVTDPQNEGVGIAAPQVGIGRRMVAVQRMDKEGTPFEFYVNPTLVHLSDEKRTGREGCLSVPGWNGKVERSAWVVLQHNDPQTFELKTDTIRGFTAVIFQHETDHLDGTLYIDKVEDLKQK